MNWIVTDQSVGALVSLAGLLQELERRLADNAGQEVPGPFIYFRRGKTVVEQI